MRLIKYIFILFLFITTKSFAACDFTTSEPVVIIPSGTHNSAVGYTQTYVLTDSQGEIVAISTTGNFGIQNFGAYYAYALNYENANQPVLPVVGANISSITGGCFSLSSSLSISVCNTSIDSVCEGSGNSIVIAMNPDFNFQTGFNQYIVIVDGSGNIVSIKPLDLTTGMVSYTTDAITGELTLGNYTVFAVNFEDPSTIASLGFAIGNNMPTNFGGACVSVSNGDVVKVESCCSNISFDLDAIDLTCFANNSGQINISNISGGTPTYTFSIDNGITYQSGTNFSSLDTGYYNVYIKDTLGCIDSNQVQINQPNELVTSLTVDSVKCFGGNDGLVAATPSGGTLPYSYSWSSSLNTDSLENNLSSGLVTVTITDSKLCSIDSTVQVFEPTSITYSATILDANCSASDGRITFTVSGGVAPYQYSIDNGLTFQMVDSFPNLAAGDYNVVIKDLNSCEYTVQETIQNLGTPILDSLVLVNPICYGGLGQISVYASGGTGVINYSLNSGIPQTTNEFNNLSDNVYTVHIEDQNNCSLDSVVNITAPSELLLNALVTNVSCFGLNDGSITVSPNGGILPYTYYWSSSNNTDSVEINLFSGIDTVVVTDANGCSVDSVFTITEPIDFNVTIQIIDSVSCSNLSDATILASVSDNTNTYSFLWGTSASNQTSASVNNLSSGTYSVVATNNTTGCKDSTSVIVTNPLPLVINTEPNQTICIGQSATITAIASGGTGVLTFNWDNGLGSSSSHIVAPSITTVYTVSVVDENNCSSVQTSVTVMVKEPLSVQVFKDDTICLGSSINITSIASGGDGNYIYVWSNGENTNQMNVTPSITTNYVLTLSDGCGTPTVTDNVTITIINLPDSTFNETAYSGCYPVNAVYHANTINSNYQYQWSSNNIIISNYDSLNNDFSTIGCQDIALQVSEVISPSLTCTSSHTFSQAVCVYDYPSASFVYDSTDLNIFNPEVNFSNLSSNADNYIWSVNGFDFSFETNPTYIFPSDSAGIYLVCLEANNSIGGCSSTFCKEVNVKDVDLFYIPNTFTPDGDFNNDIFKPVMTGYDTESYSFKIFDRWGELIFNTDDIEKGWDGVYKNKLVQMDVYVWKISAKTLNKKELKDYVGHVNILY